MIRTIIFIFLVLLSFVNKAESPLEFFSEADAFLKKYVANGLVNYKSLKKNPAEINSLYRQLGDMELSREDDKTRKAFYINAYNLAVIYTIVKLYPIKSPLDHTGFFDKEKHRIAGEELTLDALEKKKLLGTYGDARFHFALVCAAKSCPPLRNEAFVPDKTEQQLREVTMAALNDKNFIKVYPDKKKVELSKIFEWYKNDFTSNRSSVIEWINEYRKEKIPENYAVYFYEYDWALNGNN